MTFELTNTAKTVLQKRKYFINDETEWVHVCNRVCNCFANNEDEKKEFLNIFLDVDFLPNSPVLFNAGTDIKTYSACFVLPIGDSIEEIYDFYKNAALISKAGGGVGANYSSLRPENSNVKTTSGVASGPLSFMSVQDKSTDIIKQGSKRRGANMGILDNNHDDILEFIKAKETPGVLENFNLTVRCSDEFMERKNIENSKEQKLWDILIEKAWSSAEPGVIFGDIIERDNVVPHLGELRATNPCGEQPLLDFENCCLGSINLSNIVYESKFGKKLIDLGKLRKIIRTSVKFLNRVLDKSEMPIPEVQKAMNKTRKIGLGIMGLHDLLIQLGLPYDSEDGRLVGKNIMKYIYENANEMSVQMGKEEGLYLEWRDVYPKRRNANLTTIAPTGTISMVADCSSGIEPYYSVIVEKHVMEGEKLILLNKWFEPALLKEFDDQLKVDAIIDRVKKTGTIDIPEVPEHLKSIFKSANEISPINHVKMQAALQEYVDSSISKTINMPNNATKKDVKDVYELAYELGCKGITVYRDGSRGSQVLNTTKEVKEEIIEFQNVWNETEGIINEEVSLPSEYPVVGKKIRSENKKWYINICFKDSSCTLPFALFVTTNSKERNIDTFGAIAKLNNLGRKKKIKKIYIDQNTKKCSTQTNVVKIARTLGLLLRHNVSIVDIVDVLDKVDVPVSSFVFRIKKLLSEYIPENANINQFCPDCGSKLIFVEGCKRCSHLDCQWSKCG